ncbi:hypothetical protein AAG570_007618 [Ranatra chinensis]|uniref:RNA helicase aquarius N-terminal domain-containing protein n=1 Tax=Ranatra chinensis TaxID=642074 RepID=A0ABD0YFU5_9HEMI
MMLEFSQYLENYLWPNYETDKASYAHMMSIVVMINEKFRERVPAWNVMKQNPVHVMGFFRHVFKTCLNKTDNSFREKTALIMFLTHAFNSMEVDLIREQLKRLISLSMWVSLQLNRREQELRNHSRWRKFWGKVMKKDVKENLEQVDWERRFLHRLILNFMHHLAAVPDTGIIDPGYIHYCERFLELMIDLEASLPTRRFFNTVLDDSHLLLVCEMSPLVKNPQGKLFAQVSCMICFF